MASQSVAELIDILERDQYLDYAQLEELKGSLAPRYQEPKALARELMQRGWLTPYQVNQLLTGKASELVLEPYLILERLGEGAMGQVFKARHQTMRRVVALKVVHRRKLTDPEVVQWFYHEVQAASQITHPNVVHAYDAGPIGDTHFLAMECVEGSDVEQRVKKEGPLTVAEACELVRQVALGLQAIAEAGLVHRDIKPANILVAKKKSKAEGVSDGSSFNSSSTNIQGSLTLGESAPWGRAKILDLGLASLRSSHDAASSSEGILVGTPDYVAPEQALEPDKVDIRADLYSLGGTFYYMLTGQPPFPEGNWMEKLRKHATEMPVPVEQRRRGITPAVSAVVRRLLAKQPEARFQTPAELAGVMSSILATGNWPQGMSMETPSASTAIASGNVARLLQDRYVKKKPTVAGRVLGVSWRVARGSGRLAYAGWRKLSGRQRAIAAGLLVVLLIVGYFTLWPADSVPEKKEPDKPPTKIVRPELTIPGGVKLPLAFSVGENAEESAQSALANSGLPSLEGAWYHIGPFDNSTNNGFDAVYPPEKEIDLKKSYPGKKNEMVSWQPFADFKPGAVVDFLPLYKDKRKTCMYLYHEMESKTAMQLPVSLGSDDTLTIWLNGKKVLAKNTSRGVKPGEDQANLDLQAGKNQLLMKICNGDGGWGVYIAPVPPTVLLDLVEPKTPPALVVQCGRGVGPEQEDKVDRGYGYNLRKGSNHTGWPGPVPHCWFDKESLRFEVHVPPRTSGRLYLNFVDPDSLKRRQRLLLNGKVIGDYDGFSNKHGKTVVLPITADDQKNGIISVQIDNLNPMINAVVSSIVFYPDAK
ncbi:MAG: serine/threonine protein kinase [Gemmataceae bacterium]